MTYKKGSFTTVSVSGQSTIDAPDSGALTLAEGSNVTLTTSGSTVTIASSGGSGGGGFSLSSTSADITLGDFQTAYNAASSKGFSVSPSGLAIPSGKTLLGVSFELQNTLGSSPYGSWSAAYSACAIGIADPSGSTIMPTFIGGAWNGGTSYNQGSPYLSAQVGPAPGWYYQDASYNNTYIVNDGTTSTDPITSYGSACINVSASTQVNVYYYEDPSQSTTYSISGSNSASTRVLHKVTIFYA